MKGYEIIRELLSKENSECQECLDQIFGPISQMARLYSYYFFDQSLQITRLRDPQTVTFVVPTVRLIINALKEEMSDIHFIASFKYSIQANYLLPNNANYNGLAQILKEKDAQLFAKSPALTTQSRDHAIQVMDFIGNSLSISDTQTKETKAKVAQSLSSYFEDVRCASYKLFTDFAITLEACLEAARPCKEDYPDIFQELTGLTQLAKDIMRGINNTLKQVNAKNVVDLNFIEHTFITLCPSITERSIPQIKL